MSALDKGFFCVYNYKVDLDFKVNNGKLAVTRFASDREALVYIANYSSCENESFTLELPAGSRIAASSKEEKINSGKNTFKLAPAEFILIYTELNK